MKALKVMILACAIWAGAWVGSARAQSTNPPPPVVVDKDKDNVPDELKEIKALAKTFASTREAYLAQQKALLAQLKGATADQREAIRDQLQQNRAAFLAELRAFRQEIQQEVHEIKAIIRNRDLDRLIDAGQTPTGRHGKG